MEFGRLPWWMGAAFAGFGLLFAAPMWWFLAVQHYRLATYLPVEARVEQSRVILSGNDTYEPLITYSYGVNGRRYEGHRVRAIGSLATAGSWAWDVAANDPVGGRTTAWYSAASPGNSFLVREVLFFPYLFAMAGFVFLFLGGYALVQTIRGRKRAVPPLRGRDGWLGLRQEFSLRDALYLCIAAAVVWYEYYAIVLGDYVALKKNPTDLAFLISAAIAAGAGVIWVIRAWKYWRLRHDFMDAQLSTDRDRFQLGGPVRVRLDQEVSRRLKIEELSLGAVCMRSDRIATRTALSGSVTYSPATVANRVSKRLEVDRVYTPGSRLSAICEFTLPAVGAPSSPPGSSEFPIYRWFLVVQVLAEGQPKLDIRFPITVESAT